MFWYYCSTNVLYQYEDVHSCINGMDAPTRLLDSRYRLLDETVDHLQQQLVLAGHRRVVYRFTIQSDPFKCSKHYLQQMVWRQRTWFCHSSWWLIHTYWICRSIHSDWHRICRHLGH